MATPDLSPPSSTTSSDDEHPFFSALPTSASPFYLDPPCTVDDSVGRIRLVSKPDTFHYPEDDSELYTQFQIYQNPSYASDSDIVNLKILSPTFSAQQPDSPSVGCLPPNYPKVAADLHPGKRLRWRSDSDSTGLDKMRRRNQPSFIKFPDALYSNKSQLHGLRSPHPRCIPKTNNIGTEALISLAWTGEIASLIVTSGYVPSSIGPTYMWPKVKIADAELSGSRRSSWSGPIGGQQNRSQGGHQLDLNTEDRCAKQERWTLATAIADEYVTDEQLVELLEELRLRGLCSTQRSTSRFMPAPLTPADESPSLFTLSDSDPLDEESPSQSPIATSDDVYKNWHNARRALLVCREFVHTERHYLLSLQTLLNGETQSEPPPLMKSRLSALIHASKSLLGLIEANPSALGVASAFLQASEGLVTAFVQWCEVVGEFFSSKDALVRSSSSPGRPSVAVTPTGSTVLAKRVGSWGKKMHMHGSLSIDDITSMVTRSSKSKAGCKPTVRDLAILPTQRITRYVLLLKDLLVHMPASLDIEIQSTIEEAAETAVKLAQKADRAQDHASFHMTSPNLTKITHSASDSLVAI